MTRMLFVLPIVLVLLGGCGDAEHDAKAMEIELGDQVTLDDGTDVRVSSTERQEIWVQFREEGDGWTEPEKVYEETNRWTHQVELEQAGDTVAINPSYWKEPELTDDFAPDCTLQIICHDGSCGDAVVATRARNHDPVQRGRHRRLVQRRRPGVRVLGTSTTVSGGDRSRASRRTSVRRAERRILAALTGRRVGESCQLALLTVVPGETEREEAAVSRRVPRHSWVPARSGRLRGGRDHHDQSTTLTDVDTLEGLDESDLITFTRDGEWTVEQEDNPLYEVPDTLGQSTLGTIRLPLPDGSIVAIGSVDRIRITAQVVAAPERRMEPTGRDLHRAEGDRVPDPARSELARVRRPVIPPAFAVVGCGEDDGSPLRRWQHTQGFILTSTDGYEWSVRPESERPSALRRAPRRPMPAYGVPIGARGGAVALAAVARGVGVDLVAAVGRAPAEPVHAAAGEVQRGAGADQGPQLAREGDRLVAVVDVPRPGVRGQPRVRGGLGEQDVEQCRPALGLIGVDDLTPLVQEGEDLGKVRRGRAALEDHAGPFAAGHQLGGRLGAPVGQVDGQHDRILAVRVELHKGITPR